MCDTDQLEAVANRGCFPTHEQVYDSLGIVDFWVARHIYHPFLLTLMASDPWFGIAWACVYESVSTINSIYADAIAKSWWLPLFTTSWGTVYTGTVDGLLQDPFQGSVGALIAFILSMILRRHFDVSWNKAVSYWTNNPWFEVVDDPRPSGWSGVWSFLKIWTVNLFIFYLMFEGSGGLTKFMFGDSNEWAGYKYGSSNQAIPILWLLVMAACYTRDCYWKKEDDLWKVAWYTLLVLALPHFIISSVAGGVWHNCVGRDWVKCSTFFWVSVSLATYTLCVGVGCLIHASRREDITIPSQSSPKKRKLYSLVRMRV